MQLKEYSKILAAQRDSMIGVINDTLKRIDSRLTDHGERVAYLSLQILEHSTFQDEIDPKTLFILALFHDIGAYKTDEIDKMIEFETVTVWNHSIYGYLFLKHMTSIGENARAILYHHAPYTMLDFTQTYALYAALIMLADRADILMQNTHADLFSVMQNDKRFYAPCRDAFLTAVEKSTLLRDVQSGAYHAEIYHMLNTFDVTAMEALEYLRLLVYSIDFRSEFTVTHTINTTAISVEIAKLMQLSEEICGKIYYGAFLHDIGKITIPLDILEFGGGLTDEQMERMKAHVTCTTQIIEPVVTQEICRIAGRHHEKIDGSGYPEGLTGAEMTLPEKIVAVADILSALTSRRSYKKEFPRQKTLDILTQMKDAGKLDRSVCDCVIQNYDMIMEVTDARRDPVIRLYNTLSSEYLRLCSSLSVSQKKSAAALCYSRFEER